MTTYYAVTDCHGPISRRIQAAGDEEAMDLLRRGDHQAWLDEPATDAEDDLGIPGAPGMGPTEFAASLQRAGLEWVGEHDGWDLWRAETAPRCCPVVIVTRHRGAVEWLQRHGIRGEVRDHITADELAALQPCWIIGVLPLPLAVAAVQAGHRYVSLQLDLSRAQRGKELGAEEMEGIATLLELQLQHQYLYGDSPWRHWPDGIPDAHAGDLQAFRIGLANISPAELKEEMES